MFDDSRRAIRSFTSKTVGATLLLVISSAGCATPDPTALREQRAEEALAFDREGVTLDGPLTLEQAIALAIEHDLEHQLQKRQLEILEESRKGALLALLPSLNLDGEYRHQSKLRISSSISADSRRESLEPSFASERDTVTGSFELAWGLVDFGLSYFRSRQAAHREQAATHELRRAAQNLTLEVTRHYQRARVADVAVRETSRMLARLRERQARVRKLVEKRQLSELQGVRAEERLVTLRQRLQAFRQSLREAKLRLASRIRLAPGQDITFPAKPPAAPAELPPVADLEAQALRSRPELFGQDLQELIAEDEVRAAIVNCLPSPQFFAGGEADQNRFLRHHSWLFAGVRMSYNLLALPRKISQVREARLARLLDHDKRLALAAGVLLQVRLAVLDIEDATERLTLAREMAAVQQRRVGAMKKLLEQGQTDEGGVLDAEAEALYARIALLEARSLLAVARARVDNTVGK